MSRYTKDRENCVALDLWPAPMLARAIDRGLIDGFPWEVTRAGHRLKSWDRLEAEALRRDNGNDYSRP